MAQKTPSRSKSKLLAPGRHVTSKSFLWKAVSFACLLAFMYLSVHTEKKIEHSSKDDIVLKAKKNHSNVTVEDESARGSPLDKNYNEKTSQLLRLSSIGEEVAVYNGVALDKVFNPYISLRRSIYPHEDDDNEEESSAHKIKIALLISFPNSGTSYTLKNTRQASNITTASNYCGHKDDNYVPIWSNDPNSPQPHLIPEGVRHERPKDFVLTKTHCHHCDNCAPRQYVVSRASFQRGCLTECAPPTDSPERSRGAKARAQYSLLDVGKVVHLIRSPFDNIISRYHCFMNGALKRKDKPKYAIYRKIDSNTTEGFKDFCRIQDAKFLAEEREAFGDAIMDMARDVPCHSDFLRYVVWHNQAFEMTSKWAKRMQIETHILHYEDYLIEYNATVEALLRFLEMPRASEPIVFHWSNYSGYYTEEEISSIRNFVQNTASEPTLTELRRYGF